MQRGNTKGGTNQAGSTTWSASCTASEVVGDAVYISADGAVRQAQADDEATSDVAGFVVSKPTATSCIVDEDGPVTISSLVAGDRYWLSEATPGTIRNTEPGQGSWICPVGKARTTTSLLVEIGPREYWQS